MPEPLSFTVHSMPSPALDEAARRTASGRLKMLLVLLVCAAPVIASYFTYFVIRPEGRSYADLVTPPRALPADLPLATLGGDPVSGEALHGQWLLVVASDARCDAACEKLLLLQRQLREATGADKGRIDKLWLVADTAAPPPEVLRALAQGDPVTVLRVPPDALQRWLAPAKGRALAEHLYVVDPFGRWMMRAPADPDPSRLKRDLERLLRAAAGWDRSGR